MSTNLDSSFARFEGVNEAALQKHERAFKHHCMGTSTYALVQPPNLEAVPSSIFTDYALPENHPHRKFRVEPLVFSDESDDE